MAVLSRFTEASTPTHTASCGSVSPGRSSGSTQASNHAMSTNVLSFVTHRFSINRRNAFGRSCCASARSTPRLPRCRAIVSPIHQHGHNQLRYRPGAISSPARPRLYNSSSNFDLALESRVSNGQPYADLARRHRDHLIPKPPRALGYVSPQFVEYRDAGIRAGRGCVVGGKGGNRCARTRKLDLVGGDLG